MQQLNRRGRIPYEILSKIKNFRNLRRKPKKKKEKMNYIFSGHGLESVLVQNVRIQKHADVGVWISCSSSNWDDLVLPMDVKNILGDH